MTAPDRGYVAVMRDNDYPNEVSDPESSGLPDTADDDSTAYDEVDSGRWADGPDPAALPGVGPGGGATRFGNTAEEARVGEGLDRRLKQEEPDIQPEDPLDSPGELPDVAGRPVGRIVDIDEGYGVDTETDSVAYDAGSAGGGATVEELAMHETQAPDYR
jgi:hypothetical protein